MRLDRCAGVDEFLDAAGELLAPREAEHNLIYGIAHTLRVVPDAFDGPPFLAVVRDGDRVALAVLRTPPFNLVLSVVDDDAALDPLVADLAGAMPDLPGVLGPTTTAATFAARFAAATGRSPRIRRRERIHRLARVVDVPPSPGRMRIADEGDRERLADWIGAFQREAFADDLSPPAAMPIADRWVRRLGRTMYLWEDEGAVVSMAGAGGETPHGIRIGPVYTPPERRSRGYATTLTAEVSRAQLAAGRDFCFLFTDLANPTSNKIYAAIGYRPVIDVDEWVFEAPA